MQRHEVARSAGRVSGSATRLQRLRRGNSAFDRVLLERQPQRKNLTADRCGEWVSAWPDCRNSCNRTLQYDVERVDSFQALVGDNVLNAPLFQENLLTFCVPYGLALQCLKLTDIHTTLLPPEIATARKIRRKKPWAVATAATLLAGVGDIRSRDLATCYSRSAWRDSGRRKRPPKKISKGSPTQLKANYSSEKGKNKSLQDAGQTSGRCFGYARVLAGSLQGDRRVSAARY